MILLFLILLAFLVLLLQYSTSQRALDQLTYEFTCDGLLVEPDEAVTVQAAVTNRGLLPVMYMSILSDFPPHTQILAAPDWLDEHVTCQPRTVTVRHSFYLMPHRRRVCRMQVSMPQRGWYSLGSAMLSVGDFLGIDEQLRRERAEGEIVILPRRAQTPQLLHALGGFLGDVSVRRFILEDPTLTAGFQEYTGREPMKSISWPQSARSGRMMVRQYDHTTDYNITVLLNAEGGTAAQMEQCYSLARTVCEELESRGIPYDMSTNGDLMGPMGFLPHVAEGLGKQHLQTILYGLGRAKCQCRFSWKQLVEQTLHANRLGRSYILITPPLSAEGQHLAEKLRSTGGLCTLVGQEVPS